MQEGLRSAEINLYIAGLIWRLGDVLQAYMHNPARKPIISACLFSSGRAASERDMHINRG